MMQGSKAICKKQPVCMPFFSKCVTFGSVGGDNLSGVGHLCKTRVKYYAFLLFKRSWREEKQSM